MSHAFGIYVHTVMERGADEAQQLGSETIEAEHLLLAIAAQREDTTQRLLDSAGLDYQKIRDALDQEFKQSLTAAGVSVAGRDLPRARKTSKRPSKIGESSKLVLERGMATVGTKEDLRPAHVLLGLLALKFGTVPRALAIAGVDRDDLLARTEQALPGGNG